MKSKNSFVTIGVIALFVIGLILVASPKGVEKNLASVSNQGSESGSDQPDSANSLSASETFFDFGKISMAKGIVSHDFRVKNAGGPTKVSKVYTSCMCTTAIVKTASDKAGPFGMPGHGFVPRADVEVGAGEEFTVTAIFNPSAHGPAGVGRNDRLVYVETDSGEVLDLNFTALVTP